MCSSPARARLVASRSGSSRAVASVLARQVADLADGHDGLHTGSGSRWGGRAVAAAARRPARLPVAGTRSSDGPPRVSTGAEAPAGRRGTRRRWGRRDRRRREEPRCRQGTAPSAGPEAGRRRGAPHRAQGRRPPRERAAGAPARRGAARGGESGTDPRRGHPRRGCHRSSSSRSPASAAARRQIAGRGEPVRREALPEACRPPERGPCGVPDNVPSIRRAIRSRSASEIGSGSPASACSDVARAPLSGTDSRCRPRPARAPAPRRRAGCRRSRGIPARTSSSDITVEGVRNLCQQLPYTSRHRAEWRRMRRAEGSSCGSSAGAPRTAPSERCAPIQRSAGAGSWRATVMRSRALSGIELGDRVDHQDDRDLGSHAVQHLAEGGVERVLLSTRGREGRVALREGRDDPGERGERTRGGAPQTRRLAQRRQELVRRAPWAPAARRRRGGCAARAPPAPRSATQRAKASMNDALAGALPPRSRPPRRDCRSALSPRSPAAPRTPPRDRPAAAPPRPPWCPYPRGAPTAPRFGFEQHPQPIPLVPCERSGVHEVGFGEAAELRVTRQRLVRAAAEMQRSHPPEPRREDATGSAPPTAPLARPCTPTGPTTPPPRPSAPARRRADGAAARARRPARSGTAHPPASSRPARKSPDHISTAAQARPAAISRSNSAASSATVAGATRTRSPASSSASPTTRRSVESDCRSDCRARSSPRSPHISVASSARVTDAGERRTR
jgi:hypothetical protein